MQHARHCARGKEFVILRERSESKDLRILILLSSGSMRRSFDFALRAPLRMTGFPILAFSFQIDSYRINPKMRYSTKLTAAIPAQ